MSTVASMIDRWVDYFIPDEMKTDINVYKRVRMFVISHMFGPFLGHPITVYLFSFDPNPWPHVHILGISVTLFFAFPLALRRWPNAYSWLAVASITNLNFAILVTAYHFGGASSPFLMWLLVIPLLAFFYLGSGLMTRIVSMAEVVVGLAGFYAIYLAVGSFPQHIPLSDMVEVTLISALSASTYIFLMASYYASVVDSQSELIKEIKRHQETMRDLKTAKDDAERANGAKSDFLAKMSHELRTPLNAVLGYSEILLEDAELDGNGAQIADLQKISAAGKHLLAMVNDILDISKIEAGKSELYVEEVDFDKFLSEIEMTARPLAAKNTNAFDIICAEPIGQVKVDLTKLRQAIFNLMSNAAKFCQNGKITMSVTRGVIGSREMLTISVSDTGIGIEQEALDNLFENFAQANASVTAKFGGTGLGLSLSRNLCRLMGGDITVESAKNEGSTFTITVPTVVQSNTEADEDSHAAGETLVAKQADETGGQEAEIDQMLQDAAADLRAFSDGDKGTSSTSSHRGTILVIDDDKHYLEIMDRTLRKEGFRPVLTDRSEAVLQLARTVKPFIVLMDVLMPGTDGWTAVRTLRANADTASIPLYMVSVMDTVEDDQEALVDGFLTKPVDAKQLMSILNKHAKSKAA